MKYRLFVAALFLFGCNAPSDRMGAKDWIRYIGSPTRAIDTTIATMPFVSNYIHVGNLHGLLFGNTANVILRKYGDSLQVMMLRPGKARAIFYHAISRDTIININIVARTNPKYERAKRKVDSWDSSLHFDSLASYIYSYELANKPFPQITVAAIDGNILNLPADVSGKISVLNAWYYGCPPCMAEIPGLNRLKELYDSEDVRFIALFKDSAYKAKGGMRFYNEYYSSKKGHVKEYTPYDQYHFQHAYGIDRYAGQLTIYGYPKTFLLDKEGFVRIVIDGGSDKIASMLDQQIELYKKSEGFLH